MLTITKKIRKIGNSTVIILDHEDKELITKTIKQQKLIGTYIKITIEENLISNFNEKLK